LFRCAKIIISYQITGDKNVELHEYRSQKTEKRKETRDFQEKGMKKNEAKAFDIRFFRYLCRQRKISGRTNIIFSYPTDSGNREYSRRWRKDYNKQEMINNKHLIGYEIQDFLFP
jgi:hypothetical protein